LFDDNLMRSLFFAKIVVMAFCALTLFSCNQQKTSGGIAIIHRKDFTTGDNIRDAARQKQIEKYFSRKNPFLQFVGKPYGSYHYALRDSMVALLDLNDVGLMQYSVNLLRKLPDVFHNGQWQMEADYWAAYYNYGWQGGDSAVFMDELKEMLERSIALHNPVWKVRILREMFLISIGRDVTNGMIYARQLEKALDLVTPKQYPDYAECKFNLGMMYLTFNDYLRSEKYFKDIIRQPLMKPIERVFLHSYNNLGLIYRDFYRDYNKSNIWFRHIFDIQKRYGIDENSEVWVAIANGNLGKNDVLTGNYVRGEQLLLKSYAVMSAIPDYEYVFSLGLYLAEDYCFQKRFDKARHFIQVADTCLKKSENSQLINKFSYYLTLSKYYAATHQAEMSMKYVNKALVADADFKRHYDRSRFLLLEQKQGQLEQEIEKEHARTYYRNFVFVAVVSCFIFILCVICLVLYIRQRRAYRALILRNREWASRRQPYDIPVSDKDSIPDFDNMAKTILVYMQSSKCFLNSELSLDTMARDLGINRTYLSNVVNKIDVNFKSFVNKYRIQQAIKILLENPDIAIEEVSVRVGFNNRKSFYNSFIGITGISPVKFRNSKIKM
jgi:AraC-like DNA-binding protein